MIKVLENNQNLQAAATLAVQAVALQSTVGLGATQASVFTEKWTANAECELLDDTEGREVYTYKYKGAGLLLYVKFYLDRKSSTGGRF